MSDKTWTEKTGLMKGLHHQAAAASSAASAKVIDLLPKDAGPVFDAFDNPRAYEAVRSLHARSTDAYFFIPGRSAPSIRPYAYFQGVDALPDDTGIMIQWPGIRFEVRGDNLIPAMERLTQRRADVWRVFDPKQHDAPARGATLIRSIHVIRDDEAAGPR